MDWPGGCFCGGQPGLTVRYRLGVFAPAGWLSGGLVWAVHKPMFEIFGVETQGQLTQVRVGIVVVGGGGGTF